MTDGFSLETLISGLVILVYIVFWGASFAILYHLTRFGIGVQPKRFAAAFLLGTIILFSASLSLFFNLDLSTIF